MSRGTNQSALAPLLLLLFLGSPSGNLFLVLERRCSGGKYPNNYPGGGGVVAARSWGLFLIAGRVSWMVLHILYGLGD